MKKTKVILLVSFLSISSLFAFASTAHASFIGDMFGGAKRFFASTFLGQNITTDSSIELVKNKDLNKNGKIDSGDTIKFTYTIKNTTHDTYQFNTLKTNINAGLLNSISNVEGAGSLSESGNTITFPGLSLNPNQYRKISFYARVNFYKDTNRVIGTTPELYTKDNTKLASSQLQQVTAGKMSLSDFNKFTHKSR